MQLDAVRFETTKALDDERVVDLPYHRVNIPVFVIFQFATQPSPLRQLAVPR